MKITHIQIDVLDRGFFYEDTFEPDVPKQIGLVSITGSYKAKETFTASCDSVISLVNLIKKRLEK